MEDKILDFQFELVSAKPTHQSYNDGIPMMCFSFSFKWKIWSI